MTDQGHIEVTQKFTKTSVAAMQVADGKRETTYWDVTVKGLGVRALASGVRSWVYRYRDTYGKKRQIALGDVSAVSLDAARKAAMEHAAKVTLGGNPSAERRSRRAATSLSDVVTLYLKYAEREQRPRSYVETERYLMKHAKSLHSQAADAITRVEIARLLEKVSADHGPIAANRCRAALSAMWTWALKRGHITGDANPVAFTMKESEASRERVLTDDEIRAIWTAAAADTEYNGIVRLLLLTGCRREEIGGLAWREVEPQTSPGWIVISADRMKGHVEHEVPLLPTICQVLPERPKEDTGCVFGRRKSTAGIGFSGWSKSKARLDELIAKQTGKPVEPWGLHDLRRTMSTRLNNAGVEPWVVEALLAHKVAGIAGVYNKAAYREAKISALNHWHKILIGIGIKG
jgi:integrase